MKAITRTNELRRYANLVTGMLHTAFKDVGHLEFSGNLLNALVLALERKARCACGDFQVGNLSKHVQQGLGQTVGEILIVLVPGHILERQYGNRGCADAEVDRCGVV